VNADTTEAAVRATIDAVGRANQTEIAAAFQRLTVLPAPDVMNELFRWVDELTDEVNLNQLLAQVRLPLPQNARELVQAIDARDLPGLQRAVGTDDLTTAVEVLLTLIVALRDARSRL
jgi:hypothetical protein